KVQAEVHDTYGPLGNLSLAIVQAANDSLRELAPTLGISLDGKPTEQRILVFYELLYFYSHLTLRFAVAGGLTEPQIAKLQSYLRPLLPSTAVDAFFKHWPNELKTKMQSDFFEKMNDAELEYTQCKTLWSKEQPFGNMSIFGRLANNIAALLEQEG